MVEAFVWEGSGNSSLWPEWLSGARPAFVPDEHRLVVREKPRGEAVVIRLGEVVVFDHEEEVISSLSLDTFLSEFEPVGGHAPNLHRPKSR
jgi:hypothetical protein